MESDSLSSNLVPSLIHGNLSEFQSTNGGNNNSKAPAQGVLEALNEKVCVTFSVQCPSVIYRHHCYDFYDYVSDNTSHVIRKEKSLSICLLPHPPRKAMSASCPHSGLTFALNFLQGIQFTLARIPVFHPLRPCPQRGRNSPANTGVLAPE